MGRKILLFLTVLIVSLVFAGEFRSIEAIKASGELRILQTEDYWYPFYYLDEEGKLGGIDVELGRDIAVALGVKPLFVRAVATHETLAT
ncbi:MAG TPA: transporter substrate-binding domain-containing protein, partial [Mesotoga sp.]|nr:transporter substrate-binding domain-containing protein [Mesotoga sp.]